MQNSIRRAAPLVGPWAPSHSPLATHHCLRKSRPKKQGLHTTTGAIYQQPPHASGKARRLANRYDAGGHDGSDEWWRQAVLRSRFFDRHVFPNTSNERPRRRIYGCTWGRRARRQRPKQGAARPPMRARPCRRGPRWAQAKRPSTDFKGNWPSASLLPDPQQDERHLNGAATSQRTTPNAEAKMTRAGSEKSVAHLRNKSCGPRPEKSL